MLAARTNGFTLLELLVVLAIMGLMLAIAMPFTVRTIESAALRADARQLVGDLRHLRQRAIDRQEVVSVTALSENAWRMTGRASHRASFVPTPGAKALIFFPDGSSSGGTFRLSEGDRTVEVSVSWLSGAVTPGAPQ